MVPGALKALCGAEESYGAKPVSGFDDATGGVGRRNATVAMLTQIVTSCYSISCHERVLGKETSTETTRNRTK